MSKTGDILIGISGWRYKPWRGVFYPKELTQKRELAYAASVFHSIEINGTFYSLQRPNNFEAWRSETPDDFVFAVKGPRFITHLKRLKDAKIPLANFLASGILALGPKLGPILWQLPPNFHFKPKQIETFLKLLPHDTARAAAIAKRHDKWMKHRVHLRTDASRPLCHAFEIRHKSFAVKEFIDMLREYKVALVCADTVEWPRLMDVTSDFIYCRLHGSEELYASGYSGKDLDQWAARVAAWATGREPAETERAVDRAAPKRASRDVFLYFDNDAKVRAPFDAKTLISKVGKLLKP
ncbi:MAG TPA: DUF72 domain-containing protein [Candidatus Acidoferrum sp.]|jgi:uncharacterized protein YecE (DUF72 family)